MDRTAKLSEYDRRRVRMSQGEEYGQDRGAERIC